MAVDRSKYRPAPISAMKEQNNEVSTRRGFAPKYDRAGFHTIKSGDNKFRIYPAHISSKDPNIWMPKKVAWLSVTTDLYDANGDKTGEQEIKRRPIFCSDIHGPKSLAKIDLVEEYIKFAKAKFEEMFETEEEKKVAAGVINNWQSGISSKLTWVMYADAYDAKGQKTLGLLEVSPSVKKKIEEVAKEMDSGDNPLTVDPFSDPEEGIAIIINKTGEKLSTEYSVKLDTIKNGKFNFSINPTPLEDSDLEKFEKFESLESKFKETFSRRDFELQKEGLLNFDTDSEFFFFEDEEWIVKMEEIQELIYANVSENRNEQPAQEDSDEDDNSEDNLPFTPEKEFKKEAARKVSGRSIKNAPIPEPESEEDDDEEEQEPEEEQKPVTEERSSTKTMSAEERIAEIKAKMAARKKQ